MTDTLISGLETTRRPAYRGWAQQASKLSTYSPSSDPETAKPSLQHTAQEAKPTSGEYRNGSPPKAIAPTEEDEHELLPIVLSYTIPYRDLWDAQQALPESKHSWWKHTLYKGPEGERVKVHYCRNIIESEEIARTLLNEDVLGFDMEWAPRNARGIKGNISLIQVASESTIALFHIALHDGTSAKDLMAPSLRKIIETPTIYKTGVAVYAADGKRLERYFQVSPRGFFELSHLYRIVKFANTEPEKVTKGLWALAKQVRDILGLPMSKGKVRTSNWTKLLTKEQIIYSASDAYAGVMLFHTMNNMRKAMQPIPPLPPFAEPSSERMPSNDNRANRVTGVAASMNVHAESATIVQRKPLPAPKIIPYPTLSSHETIPEARKMTVEVNEKATFRPPPPLSLLLRPEEKSLFSALTALSKRISHLSKLASLHLVASEETLLELSQKRPATLEDLQTCRGGASFAALALQHKVDLLAFIKKHTRLDEKRLPFAILKNERIGMKGYLQTSPQTRRQTTDEMPL